MAICQVGARRSGNQQTVVTKPNQTKRLDLCVEVQRIVRDEGGAVIALFVGYLYAANDLVFLSRHGQALCATRDGVARRLRTAVQ